MNPPSMLTRLMANRFVALVLLLACGAVTVEWLAGGASWWLGIIALLMAMQTLSAVGQVRRYKAWSGKWQAMAEPVGAPRSTSHTQREQAVRQGAASRAKAPRNGRLPVILAALLALAIPLYVGEDIDRASPALAWLWLAVGLYLGFRLLRRVMRRGVKRHEQETAPQKREAGNPFVIWVMNRPSSSPSRAEATRALPDYCARLLTR